MSYTTEKESLASLGNFCTFKVTETVEVAAGVDFESNLVVMKANTPGPLVLHWGVGIDNPKQWKSPATVAGLALPAGSQPWDDKATQTTFQSSGRLCFVELHVPGCLAINFVFKDATAWYNNGGKDFTLSLKPTVRSSGPTTDVSGPAQTMVEEVIDAEANFGSWTLMHRFGLCEKWLEQLGDTREGCLWIYIWMRYSSMRKLDWQRRYNTKPKDLSWAQRQLTFALTRKLSSAQRTPFLNPCRLLRAVLGTLGKGGDNGQRIRDQILEIMHRNGVKENHGTFYEQWHQKLHNNTTPDDVGICEAVIAFNETNDLNRYKQVLASHGLNEARLASYERAITLYPDYKPHLVNDLKDYLRTLKSVHGSTDLNDLIGQAKWACSSDLQQQFNDILGNVHHWDTLQQMQRVTGARLQLGRELNYSDPNKARDLNFADFALEGYVRLLTEKIIHVELAPALLLWELNMLLENFILTCDVVEAQIVKADFKHFTDRCGG
jgi:alpha-glucan,water dikinase